MINTLMKMMSKGSGGSVGSQLGLDDQVGLLIFGQSNTVGTNVGSPTAPYNSAISGTYLHTAGGAWSTTIFPGNNAGALAGMNVGPELSLGYTLQAALGRFVYMAKVGKTGASLFSDPTNPHFNIDSAGADPLYPTLRTEALALYNKILTTGKTPRIIVIIIQGERDTLDLAKASAYDTNLDSIITQLGVDGVPIHAVILNLLNQAQDAGTVENRAIVKARQQAYVAAHPGFAYALDLAGYELGADVLHYTVAAQQLIGAAATSITTTNIFTSVETVSGSYSVDAKTRLKNYKTLPTAYKDAIAAFIDGCQTDGNLTKLRELQLRGLDVLSNSLLGMNGIANATNFGGTFTAKSDILYNGTSSYLDTGFNPQVDGGSLYTLNDGFYGWYVKDNLVTGVAQLGGVTGSGAVRNSLTQESTQLAYRINSTTAAVHTPEDFFADAALYIAARTASNAVALNKNGTNLATSTTGSASLPGGPMFEGANDSSGTAASFLNAKISLFVVGQASGFSFSAFSTRVNTLLTAIAAIP